MPEPEDKPAAVATDEPQNAATNGAEDGGRSKRARKQVEFFKPAEAIVAPSGFAIKEGHGSKLGDIPNVKFLLSKYKSDDDLIVNLHHLLFKSKGQAHLRKKHVFEFSGWVYEGEEEAEKKKLEDRLNKWSVDLLNRLLDAVELPRGSGEEGHKSNKVSRIVGFLAAPKPLSEKDLAAEAEKKREKARQQKEKEKAKKDKPTPSKKRKAPSSASKKKKKDEEEEEEEGSDAEGAEEEAEEQEEEEAKPAKKKAKKETKATPTKAAAKSPAKKAAAKKPAAKSPAKKAAAAKPKAKPKAKAAAEKAKKETPKKGKQEAAVEEEDGGPLPSEEELREAIKEIIQGAQDPAAVTRKQLLNELKAKFKVSLKARKQQVSAIAMEFLPVAGEDGGADEEMKDAKEDVEEGGDETAGVEPEEKDELKAEAEEEDPKEEAAEKGDGEEGDGDKE